MSDKLISANALLEAGRNTSEFQQHLADEYDLECLIVGMPAVDAVEVVRCRDCVHFSKRLAIGTCKRIPDKPIIPMRWDNYCMFGKRREGNV